MTDLITYFLLIQIKRTEYEIPVEQTGWSDMIDCMSSFIW